MSCDSLLSVPSSFPLLQVQSRLVQMGMSGSLVVHLYPDGFKYYLWAFLLHSLYGVPPCSNHRHLLQHVCSQNTEEASTRGQTDGWEGEEREREKKDSQKWETCSECGEGRARAEQQEGRKGERSGEKQAERKSRDKFHEEEGLRHHRRHPGCPHTQLPPHDHLPVSGGTSSSSRPQVSVSGIGFGCCSQLYLSAASALPAQAGQAALYEITKHLRYCAVVTPVFFWLQRGYFEHISSVFCLMAEGRRSEKLMDDRFSAYQLILVIRLTADLTKMDYDMFQFCSYLLLKYVKVSKCVTT